MKRRRYSEEIGWLAGVADGTCRYSHDVFSDVCVDWRNDLSKGQEITISPVDVDLLWAPAYPSSCPDDPSGIVIVVQAGHHSHRSGGMVADSERAVFPRRRILGRDDEHSRHFIGSEVLWSECEVGVSG